MHGVPPLGKFAETRISPGRAVVHDVSQMLAVITGRADLLLNGLEGVR